MQFSMTFIMSTPKRLPITEPIPPNKLVPPTIAAVIISKVNIPPPMFGWAAFTRMVRSSPASAARLLQRT